MIRITELKLNLDKALDEAMELANLRKLVCFTYDITDKDILVLSLHKKAIDARQKTHVFFVYSIDLQLTNETAFLSKGYKFTNLVSESSYDEIPSGNLNLKHRPVIIGFGPSGMFAALVLARRGYKPIVLERGSDVDSRTKKVKHFFATGKYSDNASILFGEGGAGTYSDGKLTTMINDLRCRYVLDELVKAGGDKEILYINKPHVGTDKLRIIVKNIRQEIMSLGGEVFFNTKVTDFIIEDNILKGVIVSNDKKIDTDICLLGIGHNARDTFAMLHENKVSIAQKPFSIGLRIEHPQRLINEAQYGRFAAYPNLGPADYKLNYHSPNGRNAYTFCMCPGGYVVCSSSEENGVVTNGMSESRRDNVNANSALLVNVDPSDFGSIHPLAGIEFQREFERKAFLLGGRKYNAPIQMVGDFLNDRTSNRLGVVKPSYKPGVKFAKMTDLLPKYITDTLKEAIIDFDHKLKGFALPDAILTGVETRSSSPVRILRNDDHLSNIEGLYPMGEGAGYAGGIMSSAVDGIKTAEKVISKYASL